MKLIMENWRRFLTEGSQWGNFTGGAAPLDPDPTDPADMPYEQQLKVFELMVDSEDKDPNELLNYPERFQNGLSFPDLQEDDVEDILSKLGLPEMDDPKWQRHIIGRSAVEEAIEDEPPHVGPPKTIYDEGGVQIISTEDEGILIMVNGERVADGFFDRSADAFFMEKSSKSFNSREEMAQHYQQLGLGSGEESYE